MVLIDRSIDLKTSENNNNQPTNQASKKNGGKLCSFQYGWQMQRDTDGGRKKERYLLMSAGAKRGAQTIRQERI
jgi:hypothetical protein